MLAHQNTPAPPAGVFYVGAKAASWLPRARTPLLLSRPALAGRVRRLPRAAVPWLLDSGAFTELGENGAWTVPAEQYAAEAARWAAEAGNLAAAGIQDWLTTPGVLDATGRTVADHQARTVASLLELRALAPELPWLPTLQGWELGDYLAHVALYADAGVDLTAEPLVGVGSIATRQHTDTVGELMAELHDAGLRLHAFGAKVTGLARWGTELSSADSMAWSLDARRMDYRCGRHRGDCRNCQWWAEAWGERMAAMTGGSHSRQLTLGDAMPMD